MLAHLLAAALLIRNVTVIDPASATVRRGIDVRRAKYDNSIFGRVYWLEHLDDNAVDEMVRALVEHHVVIDPTLVAGSDTPTPWIVIKNGVAVAP